MRAAVLASEAQFEMLCEERRGRAGAGAAEMMAMVGRREAGALTCASLLASAMMNVVVGKRGRGMGSERGVVW